MNIMTNTDKPSTDKIEKTIDLKAPVEKVWKALTDYKEFGAWFRVNLDGPFVVGETATGRMSIGSHCGHDDLKWNAVIKRMDAPTYFAFTWHPYAIDPTVDYESEPPTLVEFKLEKTAGGTRLTVVESGFDKIPAGRRVEALRMNDGGWAMQVENIRKHVES